MTAALPRLVVIAGPTASGKSALALGLAGSLGAELVVADSRQVYRHMDIGTAKAGAAARSRVVHHAVDAAEPGDDFDAARFAALAVKAIDNAGARGVPVIVEGGTGLYLRALLHGLVDAPARDPELRDSLRHEAGLLGWPALHARLAAVDADYASRIQPTDPVRITRALEVHALTGVTLTEHHRRHGFREARFDVLGVMLDVDAAALRQRIAARVEGMWRAGIVDETRALASVLGEGHRLLQTINYAQALEHLAGRCNAAQARAEMALRTSQFAKRQRTWFRAEPGLAPLRPEEQDDFLARARQFLRE